LVRTLQVTQSKVLHLKTVMWWQLSILQESPVHLM